MEGLDWKSIAAIWGGALATINSIYLMLARRPIFVLGPAPNQNIAPTSLYLTIHNPSQYPVQITKLWRVGRRKTVGVFPKSDNSSVRTDVNDVMSWLETIKTNRFLAYVAPNSDTILEVNTIKKETSEVLVFLYHRHRFLLPPGIKIILITGEKAKQCYRGGEDFWNQ
jgi:hypothetical protein